MKPFRIIGGCFRWTARVVSGLTVLMFLAFSVGEGIPAPSSLATTEFFMFIGLAAALIGLLVSWRWTLAGCLLALVGYTVFSIGDKKFHLASPFSIFLIVVALYAINWIFDRLSTRHMEAVNG